MRNDLGESCGEKQNTILCLVSLFLLENRTVYELMWGGYCRDGQATDNNMALEHCMLDN